MLKAKQEISVSLSSPEFMEEKEEEDAEQQQTPTSPFWIQTTTNRRLSSIFFNSFVLIIFLLLFAILSMVVIIPSLIRLSSNVFRPNLVKRSWDSINLILVFIALVFGFLSRNINNDEKLNLDNGFDEKPILDNGYDRVEPEISAGAPIMYDVQDQSLNSAIGLRRQRTSVSYPDLRELSPPWNHHAGDPWRFSDDTHFNYYNVLESHRNSFRQRSRRDYNSGTQDVEKSNLYAPPPPQPPANMVKQKTKRGGGYGPGKKMSPETESPENNGRRDERKRVDVDKRRAKSSEPKSILSPVIDRPPEPPLPPPASPLTDRIRDDDNSTRDFFTSFYHKKKKRQRDRSVENLNFLLHHSQPLTSSQSCPHMMTESGVKEHHRNKFTSITRPSPPPPPPPPPRTTNYARQVTIKRVAPFITDKPGASLMMTGFTSIEDSSSGGESPMKQIPPPPPLPPFKMPDWKFAVEGDFVRLQSTLSSRSASPDGDEPRSPSSDVDTTTLDTGLFFPGPDVDTKADSFIERFRAGLKLERMSKLGPGSGSNSNDN